MTKVTIELHILFLSQIIDYMNLRFIFLPQLCRYRHRYDYTLLSEIPLYTVTTIIMFLVVTRDKH